MILGTLLVCVVTVSLVASASAQRPPPKPAADSLNVTQVGSIVLTEDGIVTDLYVAGNHAYVGSAENTLYIVDISDPANMRLAAQVTTEGPALDVKVAGNLAVVGGASGVTVIDISEPSSPRILSQVPVEPTTCHSTRTGPISPIQAVRARAFSICRIHHCP